MSIMGDNTILIRLLQQHSIHIGTVDMKRRLTFYIPTHIEKINAQGQCNDKFEYFDIVSSWDELERTICYDDFRVDNCETNENEKNNITKCLYCDYFLMTNDDIIFEICRIKRCYKMKIYSQSLCNSIQRSKSATNKFRYTFLKRSGKNDYVCAINEERILNYLFNVDIEYGVKNETDEIVCEYVGYDNDKMIVITGDYNLGFNEDWTYSMDDIVKYKYEVYDVECFVKMFRGVEVL